MISPRLRKVVANILIFCFGLSSVGPITPVVFAEIQGLVKAQKLYQNGDFQAAERTLQILLIRDYKAKDKAQMMKLLGIVQFMQGQKDRAQSSFQMAVQYDSAVVVRQ